MEPDGPQTHLRHVTYFIHRVAFKTAFFKCMYSFSGLPFAERAPADGSAGTEQSKAHVTDLGFLPRGGIGVSPSVPGFHHRCEWSNTSSLE